MIEIKKSIYNSLDEFRANDPEAYKAVLAKRALRKICLIFGWSLIKWTYENVKAEALKYNTRMEWKTGSPTSYNVAVKNGWLEECCTHMVPKLKMSPEGYWTKQKCKDDALKYKSRKEWQKNSVGYSHARKNGWLEECCAHMIKKEVKPAGYWTKELVKKDAKRFITRTVWAKESTTAYTYAKLNGWLDECCAHMTSKYMPRGYWTLELCQAEASKYSSVTEWVKNSRASYAAAYKNGWIKECCTHMIPSNYEKKKISL